jgi:hypothetical protein
MDLTLWRPDKGLRGRWCTGGGGVTALWPLLNCYVSKLSAKTFPLNSNILAILHLSALLIFTELFLLLKRTGQTLHTTETEEQLLYKKVKQSLYTPWRRLGGEEV